MKGQDTNGHLQKIGEVMQYLLAELQMNYGQEPIYQMFERVFGEHYLVQEKVVKIKLEKELSASSLQSPDDLEATYREKNNKHYKGYVANLTETCDPENDLQLVTKVQVAAGLETLLTDGGYGSPDADDIMQDHKVVQIQSAIRGRVPSSEKLNLADFEFKQTETGKPTQIT